VSIFATDFGTNLLNRQNGEQQCAGSLLASAGTLQICRKALARTDVTPLRGSAQIGGVHVLDHALAQRAYRSCGH
jgi:hypothetical protein